MKKNKCIEVLIILGFIAYLILATALGINNLIKTGEIGLEGIENAENIDIIKFYAIIVAIQFVIEVFKNIPLIIVFLAIKFGIKKFKKSNLNVDDKNKNKEYYRDILKGYNPAILSFIDSMEIKFPSSLIAVLLSLKKKQKIEIKDNKLIIIGDISDLDDIEKYVIGSISNGNLKELNQFEYSSIIKLCISKSDLAQSDFNMKKSAFNILIPIFIISIILFNLFINFISGINEIIGIITTIIFILFTISSIIYFFYKCISLATFFIKKVMQPFVRSKKGIEMNKKLEGLKNYLKDFSDIKNDSADSLVVWDDYLIYSVIFEQNTKVVEEYSKFI